MIMFLHYPITDLRLFQNVPTGALCRPLWPTPILYKEFIRSIGQIQPRKRGGVSGWIGEQYISTANRALPDIQIPEYVKNNIQVKICCSKRFFYFDGFISGKFEAAFILRAHRITGSLVIDDFMHYFLDTKISVRENGRNIKSAPVATAGKTLMNLYQRATTSRKFSDPIHEHWFMAGIPCIVLYFDEDELLDFPNNVQYFHLSKAENIGIYHWHVQYGNNGVRIWAIKRLSNKKNNNARGAERSLRIALARLHIEYESLRAVLLSIGRGEIKKNEDTEFLQYYINETTRHLFRFDNQRMISVDCLDEHQLLLASLAFEKTNPGIKEGILKKLKAMNLRPNIYKKAESIINKIYIKEVNMGEEFNNYGVTGSMGSHSIGTVSVNETYLADIVKDINLIFVAKELELFRELLCQKAKNSEEEKAISIIDEAHRDAINGNGGLMLKRLKGAGKWVLDIAKEVGSKVIVELIMKATTVI